MNIIPSRADLLASEIHLSKNRQEAINRIFGKPGKRDLYPPSLLKAVYRRLENWNNGNVTQTREATSHRLRATSEVTDLPSLNGKEIYSKNGIVTGGKIVPNRYYKVSYGSEPMYDRIKLLSIHQGNGITTYYFVHGYSLDDSDDWKSSKGFVFVEVSPPTELKVDKNEVIEFTQDGFENTNNFNRLVDGQIYDIQQPKEGVNFRGIFDKEDSYVNSKSLVRLSFGTGKAYYSSYGKITVRAV